MEIQKKNRVLLKSNHIYDETMEHDACGVGLVASTEGLKSRKVVEYGIEALKAVWHRGAIDADGKTGDGAGIHIEIPKDFFAEKIEITGHKHDNSDLCVGMIFLPRNDFGGQELDSAAEVKSFCTINYNIDFPMTDIVHVKGSAAHPYYKWVSDAHGGLAVPRWNFHKHLVYPDGRLVNWFVSTTGPSSSKLHRAIEKILPK